MSLLTDGPLKTTLTRTTLEMVELIRKNESGVVLARWNDEPEGGLQTEEVSTRSAAMCEVNMGGGFVETVQVFTDGGQLYFIGPFELRSHDHVSEEDDPKLEFLCHSAFAIKDKPKAKRRKKASS